MRGSCCCRQFSLRRPLPRAQRNHISLPALVVPGIVVVATAAAVIVVVVVVAIKITEHLPLHTWPTLATWRLQQAKQRVAVAAVVVFIVVVIRLGCPKTQAHFASIRLTIFKRGGRAQGVLGGTYTFYFIHCIGSWDCQKWQKNGLKQNALPLLATKLVHVHFHCYCYGFSFVLLCDCHALARYIYGPLNGFATFPRLVVVMMAVMLVGSWNIYQK